MGFNRIGDVALIAFSASVGSYVLFSVDTHHISTLAVFALFASVFKSVVGISALWLPEAMEGPTPVSSLLHSCTLVMAGIFSIYAQPSLLSSFTGSVFSLTFLFILSLSICVLSQLSEKDAKRIVAGSTAVMVGVVFTFLQLSAGSTAFVVAVFHASYKSALFLSLGKLLSHSGTYSDNLAVTSAITSPLFIICIFLTGEKSSSYSSAKHTVDAVISETNTDAVLFILMSLSAILIWALGLRLFSNAKSKFAPSANDFAILAMLLTLLAANASVFAPTPSVAAHSSATALGLSLLILFSAVHSARIFSHRFSSLNFGNVCWSFDILGPFSSRYPAVKPLVSTGIFSAAINPSSQSPLVVAALISIAVGVFLQVVSENSSLQLATNPLSFLSCNNLFIISLIPTSGVFS